MKAVGNNIIFEYFEVHQTESGIFLTKANDADSSGITGKVISVGSGVTSVKVGDTIVIPKLMRTPIDKERGLWSTLESQVLAIIDG